MHYLLVNDSPKTSLALDNGVRHTHLPAQRGEENDQLNGINIIGNEHQRGLLRLNERHNMVEAILDGVRLFAHVLLLLALGNRSSLLV